MQDQVAALAELGVARRGPELEPRRGPQRRRSSAASLAGELDLLYVAPERLAHRALPRAPRARARSRSSRSTRRTASRSGGTTSAPSTWGSRCSPSGSRACRASPSPRPPTRRPGARSSRGSQLERRALRRELRPPEHPLPRRRQGRRRRRQLLRFLRRRASGRRRHRLPPLARQGRGRPPSGSSPRACAACPTTPAWRAPCAADRSSASARRRGSSSSRRSPSAWESTSRTCASSPTSTCRRARGLSPGDRPRRPRRRAGRRLDDLRPRRRGAAAARSSKAARRRRSARRVERRKLDQLLAYCETTECRRSVLLRYFGETHAGDPAATATPASSRSRTWDATVAAQKVLSAALRTGRAVRRAAPGRCRRRRTHRESGAQPPRPPADLRRRHRARRAALARRRAPARGARLPQTDVDGYNTLSLNDSARPILRGEEKILLRIEREPAKRTRKRRAAAAVEGAIFPEERLFERLRALRTELAKAAGVPPYVIFHDATLREVALRKPASLSPSSPRFPGVGAKKLERYGERLLATLAEEGAPA